jgi:hypothetical protein
MTVFFVKRCSLLIHAQAYLNDPADRKRIHGVNSNLNQRNTHKKTRFNQSGFHNPVALAAFLTRPQAEAQIGAMNSDDIPGMTCCQRPFFANATPFRCRVISVQRLTWVSFADC